MLCEVQEKGPTRSCEFYVWELPWKPHTQKWTLHRQVQITVSFWTRYKILKLEHLTAILTVLLGSSWNCLPSHVWGIAVRLKEAWRDQVKRAAETKTKGYAEWLSGGVQIFIKSVYIHSIKLSVCKQHCDCVSLGFSVLPLLITSPPLLTHSLHSQIVTWSWESCGSWCHPPPPPTAVSRLLRTIIDPQCCDGVVVLWPQGCQWAWLRWGFRVICHTQSTYANTVMCTIEWHVHVCWWCTVPLASSLSYVSLVC